MAKDKGAKPGKSKADKADRPKDSGGEFANPSEAPATGDGWRFEHEDNLGKLFLITPLRSENKPDQFANEKGATKEVIICDVVELNEAKPAKSVEHTDVWANGGWVKGSLRGFIGDRRVLARLGQGPKDRGNKPWILEDGDDDDVKVAKAYLESVDPFAVKGGKSGKGKSKD